MPVRPLVFSLVAGHLARLDARPPDALAPLLTALPARRALVLYPDDDAPGDDALTSPRAFAHAAPLLAAFAADVDVPPAALLRLLADDAPDHERWSDAAGRPSALAYVEPWFAAGGPLPYADGHALVLRTPPYDADALVRRVLGAAARAGATAIEVRRGEPAAPPRPWWRR